MILQFLSLLGLFVRTHKPNLSRGGHPTTDCIQCYNACVFCFGFGFFFSFEV